ncbi:hypothetical protein ACFCZ3_19915 [Cellulosimicrobium cellulans]|uniref:hypothetical protein n=1 Tax=Cellulosimicrobium cellulans TaxID=1710 RepID=UPI0035DE720C
MNGQQPKSDLRHEVERVVDEIVRDQNGFGRSKEQNVERLMGVIAADRVRVRAQGASDALIAAGATLAEDLAITCVPDRARAQHRLHELARQHRGEE